MRRILSAITILILWLFTNNSFPQCKLDTLYIASWNVENLFDTVDDPQKNDEEYLPSSAKEWTENKLDQKLRNLARVIGTMNNNTGPSIIGLTEVEHQYLLDSLLTRYLKNRNYKVTYAESPDNRGIDNGLIYDSEIFTLKQIDTLRVDLTSGYPTRYILQAELLHKNGRIFYLFVNHWPSRRGGEEKSRPNRIQAAEVLKARVDNIWRTDNNALICILGDFNDEPNNESVEKILGAKTEAYFSDVEDTILYNLSSKLFEEGAGTYLYNGDWNMLDQIIVSSGMVSSTVCKYVIDSFELHKPPFLLTKSGKYKGAATPTFGGRKYLGGYSDHIPIGAKFVVQSK